MHQQANQYRYHFVEENMTDILSTKNDPTSEHDKNAISASNVRSVQILIRNDYLTSEKHNAKKTSLSIS